MINVWTISVEMANVSMVNVLGARNA